MVKRLFLQLVQSKSICYYLVYGQDKQKMGENCPFGCSTDFDVRIMCIFARYTFFLNLDFQLLLEIVKY